MLHPFSIKWEEKVITNEPCFTLIVNYKLTNLNCNSSNGAFNFFQEVLDPPSIVPQTHFQVSLAYPDFSQHKVQDLFSGLGPIAIFSAKHHWTAPRLVRLRKREHEGFGFSVRGDSPVIIAGIDANSIAEVNTFGID